MGEWLMSDTPQGPGWWQASDGKFYPPESAASSTLTPAGPTPPRPLWKRWWVILIGILVLLGLISALAGPSDKETDLATDGTTTTVDETTTTVEETTTALAPSTTARSITQATSAPTTSPPATAAPTTVKATTTTANANEFGSGKREVGRDIQPGLYRTRKASAGCYWSRLKGLGGGFDDVIANDNTDGPAVVEILPTDKGFDSTRCATWTKDVSAITANRTSFGEGTFIIGTDLEPGTYRNTGGDSCYWARLSNFEGGLNSVIANDNTQGTTIVEIQAGDRGFKSSRCGSWSKS